MVDVNHTNMKTSLKVVDPAIPNPLQLEKYVGPMFVYTQSEVKKLNTLDRLGQTSVMLPVSGLESENMFRAWTRCRIS